MKGDSIAGRYRVDRVLGSGSSGFVVAARHNHTREKVALKVLTNDAPPPEVDLPSSPHIAKVVDTGYTQERQGYVATEMLEGQTVAKVLERGPVPSHLAVSWTQQACAGLAVAHRAGVFHGHLKPQNLFVTSDGVLKILDFGMNMPLVEETDQESSAAWLHSPAYLAPEQLREATFDARADVWALGVILHQLIAGSLPFESDTIAGMFVAVAYDEPTSLTSADVPEALAMVVASCLAKNAAERPTIAQLQDRLAPFAPAESMPPQMAMTIEAAPPVSEEAPPVASTDVIEPSPASRMKAAFEKASSSRPPPLPSSRLGARSRGGELGDLGHELRRELGQRFGRGWLSARLMAQQLAPDVRTHAERDFQRRRWGALGVVAAAAVLGIASIFAAPEGSAAAASELASEPVTVAELPLEFGLSGFIPPSFALPEKDNLAPVDRAPAQAATPVWTPPPRARLIVREDPYLRPFAAPTPATKVSTTPPPAKGFTHPRGLPTTRR